MKNGVIIDVLHKAMEYDQGDADRIQHLTKVHSYATMIGLGEGVSEEQLEVLELAAILHDIGIHESERLYNNADAKNQERLGPDVAKQLLQDFNLSQETLNEICLLIGNHHTYDPVLSLNHQILIEADFLVNIYEWDEKESGIKNVYNKHFKTKTGRKLYEWMYPVVLD